VPVSLPGSSSALAAGAATAPAESPEAAAAEMLQGQRLDTLSSLKQLFPDTGWDWGQQNDAEEFFIRALANSVHSSFPAGMANELFCGTVRTFYRFQKLNGRWWYARSAK
jgi:hypothetical protein